MTERERLTTERAKIFARESITLNSMNKDELRRHYNEIFDRLQEYEVKEENGLLLRLPCKVGDMVDVFFSHNAIVHLWCVDPAEEDYSTSLWRGMAWDIPQKYKEMKFEKFFGTVPEHLYEADAINILVDLTKEEAEAALKGEA